MAVSEAQKRATAKYEAKTYDQVKFKVYKGQRETIKAFAEAHGYSMNSFILEAVTEKMEQIERMEQKRPAE